MDKTLLGREVYTPLGRGKVVYVLPDGHLLVQFEHGGGQIFTRDELFPHKAHSSRFLNRDYAGAL